MDKKNEIIKKRERNINHNVLKCEYNTESSIKYKLQAPEDELLNFVAILSEAWKLQGNIKTCESLQ